MKKIFIILIAGLLLSIDSPAQGFFDTLNKAVNGLSRQSQQRNWQQNSQRNYDRQQSYESRQRMENNRNRNIRGSRYRNTDLYLRNTGADNDATVTKSKGNNSLSNDDPELEQKESTGLPQSKDKVITLVTNGTGNTKEIAILNALRSAIEQTFGTFVSANTEVLNDDLVKDEIATVASGNVSKYNILSITKNENGLYDVSLQAAVSIGNLTNYAKSKGFQVELAGAEFVMNMKMRELNKKNELAAIDHLLKKIKSIASNGGLFSYELEKNEPVLIDNSKYGVKLKLLFYGNDNTKAFYDEVYNTIDALSLSQAEINEYKKVGLKYYVYNKQLIQKEENRFDKRDLYYLRNDFRNFYFFDDEEQVSWLMPSLIEQALQFDIYDNLGNHYYCSSDNAKSKNMVWFYNNEYKHRGVFFNFVPADRIAGVKGMENEYELNTPLVDYIKNDDLKRLFIQDPNIYHLHFNPLLDFIEEDYNRYWYFRGIMGRDIIKIKESILERKRNKCYYQLEFIILYSEEELFKLENITVKNRPS